MRKTTDSSKRMIHPVIYEEDDKQDLVSPRKFKVKKRNTMFEGMSPPKQF